VEEVKLHRISKKKKRVGKAFQQRRKGGKKISEKQGAISSSSKPRRKRRKKTGFALRLPSEKTREQKKNQILKKRRPKKEWQSEKNLYCLVEKRRESTIAHAFIDRGKTQKGAKGFPRAPVEDNPRWHGLKGREEDGSNSVLRKVAEKSLASWAGTKKKTQQREEIKELLGSIRGAGQTLSMERK